MEPSPEALAQAKKIDDGWRAANGWPGMVWPDGPGAYASADRWPRALEDRVYRIALALTSQSEQKDTVISIVTQERNVAQHALAEQTREIGRLRNEREDFFLMAEDCARQLSEARVELDRARAAAQGGTE